MPPVPASLAAMEHANGSSDYTLIRDLPAAERPRERLRAHGARTLSTVELIAILLRTGTTKESAIAIATGLLRDYGVAGLADAPFQELCNRRGLGEAKTAQLKAALELGARAGLAPTDERPVYRSPDDIANVVLSEMSGFSQEHVRILLLDTRGRSLGFPELYVGNVNSSHVRISELLRDAIRVNAPTIVMLHNHPSGELAPSAADIVITKQLYDCAKQMDIELADHIIIAGGRYLSMKSIHAGFPNGQ